MTENGISQPSQQPLIDFNHIIKASRRQSTDVERQVTICRYRTFTGFDFDQVLTALERCRLTAADDFGVINVNSSKTSQIQGTHAQNNGSAANGDADSEWVRAIFGIIALVSPKREKTGPKTDRKGMLLSRAKRGGQAAHLDAC